jgi:hypothetical protein
MPSLAYVDPDKLPTLEGLKNEIFTLEQAKQGAPPGVRGWLKMYAMARLLGVSHSTAYNMGYRGRFTVDCSQGVSLVPLDSIKK